MTRWGLLFVCSIAVTVGCKDEKDSDSNDGDSDNKTAEATGAFCHSLTLDDEPIDFVLRVGTGSKMVTLSASTGECSTGLGQACEEIPVGNGINLELVDETGESLATWTADITANLEHVFSLELDDVGDLALMGGAIPDGGVCSNLECDLMYYNTQTCAAADPCAWAGDGFCDDVCSDLIAAPFDDSEDCVADCSNITDYATCITCDCADPLATCVADADCLELLTCISLCTDDTCVQSCAETSPDGITYLNALLDCGDAECAEFVTE